MSVDTKELFNTLAGAMMREDREEMAGVAIAIVAYGFTLFERLVNAQEALVKIEEQNAAWKNR